MPQKKIIELNSCEVKSHNEKKTRSSQHYEIKARIAAQLREEIHILTKKKDKASAETWKFYEEYKKWEAEGNEKEAEIYRIYYQTWPDQLHRFGEEIIAKLKAVRKFEQPMKMEEFQMIIAKRIKEEYLQYGPSDDEQ